MYVDRDACQLYALRGTQIDFKNKRDITDKINSAVAHEVAQIFYHRLRQKEDNLESRSIGEMVGKFFELDYLFRKNPRLGKQVFEQFREEARSPFVGPHFIGSRFACKLLDRVKNPRQRRKIIALIARGNFETPAQLEKFISEQKNR